MTNEPESAGGDDDDYDDGPELELTTNDQTCSINQSSENSGQRFIIVLKYCQLPCGRSADRTNPMCIRTCSCPKNYMLTDSGECKKMTDKIRTKINSNSERAIEAHLSSLKLR